MSKLKALSLFANVGISECFLSDLDVSVAVANELEPARGKFYQHVFPETEMIIGDITNDDIFSDIIQKSKENDIELIIATPPCQGMSTAGKSDPNDPRNSLIKYAVNAVKLLSPRFVFLENVPEQLITAVSHNGNDLKIPEYLKQVLGDNYHFEQGVINAADYGVPQLRERAIFLLTRKGEKKNWIFPPKDSKRKTMEDAIGHLPPLDPIIYDVTSNEMEELLPNYLQTHLQAAEISRWHKPPRHVKRQIYAMQHTPTGKSAFENEPEYQPKKQDGTTVRGYKNTYKRQNWDTPAYTITMYNRTIGSQNNAHPGRLMENGLYSDPRVLTIYEIMLIMTLPVQWNIPDWATENFIRSVIGEGIPPLLMKRIVGGLVDGL
ncbi:MAG: DNA cytosine methyltransferase [Eubacteriales bacterium]